MIHRRNRSVLSRYSEPAGELIQLEDDFLEDDFLEDDPIHELEMMLQLIDDLENNNAFYV